MIGIMSDSHDNRDAIREAIRLFKRHDCRMVLHAGDFVAPFAAGELATLQVSVRAVFGNCDGEKAGLAKTVDSFGKIKDPPFCFRHAEREFLLTHTQFSLDTHVRSGNYDVVVYGHTHRPEIRRIGRTLVVNPGETGGWVTGRKSIAILDPRSLQADIIYWD
jgi:putative phosphoesterase